MDPLSWTICAVALRRQDMEPLLLGDSVNICDPPKRLRAELWVTDVTLSDAVRIVRMAAQLWPLRSTMGHNRPPMHE